MSSLKDSEQLRIPFRDIEVATKNFTTPIGKGGYGWVYKGELSLSGRLTTVAVKRLDSSNLSGQGFKEFLTEIHLLSSYKHPNLIPLLGFCQEGQEKILIYEHAKHGSLDMYLNTAKRRDSLTWKQRVSICLDAARGLDYLHNHVAERRRVIHRDIKSANILIDQDWKAMISDFGLSKIGPANEKDTFLITNACGTHGYCDPTYVATGILTKESDVFSFGVVLFEVLCGRLCVTNVNDERAFLAPLARSCYENERLHEIVDPDLREQMNSTSMNTFSEIAYQCLQMKQNMRPSMDLVVDRLEEALQFHEIDEQKHNSVDYEEINRMSQSPMAYDTKEELYSHLSNGILLDGGKVWFSLDRYGRNCELISAMGFTYPGRCQWITTSESRFSNVAKILKTSKLNIKVQITAQFLSRGVTYAAYLVFKFLDPQDLSRELPCYVNLKYKLKEASEWMTSYLAEWRDNGWMIVELFQMIHLDENAVFEVMLERFDSGYNYKPDILIEGIEFQPIKKIGGDEDIEKSEDENKVRSLPTSKTCWDNLLPRDYKEIINMSKEKVSYTTKEDLFLVLSKGIHINLNSGGDAWFWISTSSQKKCLMFGATSLVQREGTRGMHHHIKVASETRLGSVLKIHSFNGPWDPVKMSCQIISQMFSPKTIYECYLVYKLPKEYSHTEHPIRVSILKFKEKITKTVHLIRPHSPMIGPKKGRVSFRPLNKPKIESIPKKRKDGWWEVNLLDINFDVKNGNVVLSTTCTSTESDGPEIVFSIPPPRPGISNITIQGIEFRPI